MWLNSNSFCNHDSLRDFFFSGQIDTFFSCLVMYPLRTNDSDELTYFLRFPEAPARWGISCVPLHLESVLAGETEPGQKGGTHLLHYFPFLQFLQETEIYKV